MRRVILVLAVLALVVSAAFCVSAVDASKLSSHSTVNRDGSCQVTMTMTVHIDSVRDDLEFPLPAEATAVTVNGHRESTRKAGDVRVIDLDRIIGKTTGDFSLSISYTLSDVIHYTEAKTMEMQVPMLSGFAYPVRGVSFSVTLPGEVTGKPSFESGYHQANIELDIAYSIEGATISGTFVSDLKDHETVIMKLRVSEDMFPQTLANTQDYTFGLIAMGICAGLALLYWLITLRLWPLRRIRNPQPMAGCTAGELGCVLNQQGLDLHLTVMSWAQLGYIRIRMSKKGRVYLDKRMDMGNERKEAEQKLFKKLFARKNTVDTYSLSYASLTQTAGKIPMGMQERMRRNSGNPKLFRGIASGIGLFGGVCLAIAVSGGAVLQGFMILLMGALGALSGWFVQKWGQCLLTPHKHRLILCLAVCGIWLLIGLLSGAFHVALWMVIGLLLAGLLFSWGGRRTELGKEMMAQTLGLRHYMRRGDKLLLQRLQNKDPDYFFSMAPYALALGVDKAFAKRFGNQRLGVCPYLQMEGKGELNAAEWMERFHLVVDNMDLRSRNLPIEKLMNVIQNMRKRPES